MMMMNDDVTTCHIFSFFAHHKRNAYNAFLSRSLSSACSAWSSMNAMITYPMSTTLAMSAASPPA